MVLHLVQPMQERGGEMHGKRRDTCPYGPDEAVLKCRDMFSCGWLLQNSEMDLLLL